MSLPSQTGQNPLLYLASASPRRKELLERMGITLSIHPQDVDETFLSSHPRREARRLARLKAEALRETLEGGEGAWILGADTFLIFRGRLLGKPADREGAGKMLRELSGRRHKVITGLALQIPRKGMKTWTITTPVVFHRFSPRDIEWYLDTVEWEDAAGAYKIQGAGACLVRKIIGSYPNVMGLPIDSLYGILRRYNFPFGENTPRY